MNLKYRQLVSVTITGGKKTEQSLTKETMIKMKRGK